MSLGTVNALSLKPVVVRAVCHRSIDRCYSEQSGFTRVASEVDGVAYKQLRHRP